MTESLWEKFSFWYLYKIKINIKKKNSIIIFLGLNYEKNTMGSFSRKKVKF